MKLITGLVISMLFWICFATDLSAQTARVDRPSELYWAGGGWRVVPYPDEEMCDLGVDFANGETFTVGFYPRENRYSLLFTNSEATSLKDGQEVKLWLAFLKNGKADARWGEVEFTVSKRSDRVVFGAAGFNKEIARDLAVSDSVALFRFADDDRAILVAGATLKGSSKALPYLRECSFKQSGLNPNDPFLQ